MKLRNKFQTGFYFLLKKDTIVFHFSHTGNFSTKVNFKIIIKIKEHIIIKIK